MPCAPAESTPPAEAYRPDLVPSMCTKPTDHPQVSSLQSSKTPNMTQVRLEHLRGSALEFLNLTNYIARSLLEPSRFKP